jgi:predicted AAA+ superfamily ATPase
LERSALAKLTKWYATANRKPLVIRGARQVGKSYLVRQFAEQAGIPLFELNLEKSTGLDSVFARMDASLIVRETELAIGRGGIEKNNGLLFLDEIQAVPQAIAALRYLYEDRPTLAVIAAGSLLEFALTRHNISVPVGRIEYLHLGPLTFEEYLAALGEHAFLEYLRTWTAGQEPSAVAHERLLPHLRDFLLVGGMPEAVAAFIARRDAVEVGGIHRAILDTYRDDFAKYAVRDELALLRRVFDFVPLAVGRKFKSSHVNPAWKAADVRAALDMLALAGVIHRVHHSDAVGVPLGATIDERIFKPLFLDIGLMNEACGLTRLPLEKMMQARFVNEGPMAEQLVGQHLLFAADPSVRPSLCYWLREGRKSNAEVDYVVQVGSRVVPIEVKAGAGGSLKSLHQFAAHRNAPLAVRFDLSLPSLEEVAYDAVTAGGTVRTKFRLLSLPLYMVAQTMRLAAGQG